MKLILLNIIIILYIHYTMVNIMINSIIKLNNNLLWIKKLDFKSVKSQRAIFYPQHDFYWFKLVFCTQSMVGNEKLKHQRMVNLTIVQTTVTGTVSDEWDHYPGASVLVKGNNERLLKPILMEISPLIHASDATLVISYIGYKLWNYRKQSNHLSVHCKKNASAIRRSCSKDMVRKSKKDLTGAVSS